MRFLFSVSGRTLRDWVRSWVTQEEIRGELLLVHIERSQLRWLGHLFWIHPGRLPGEVFWALGGGPSEDPGQAGGTMFLDLPDASGSHRTSRRRRLRPMKSG